MFTYRICLTGALLLIAACNTAPKKTYAPPPMPTTATPRPVPASVSVAPSNEVAPPAAVPVAAPLSEPPAPVAETAITGLDTVPAPTPAPAPRPTPAASRLPVASVAVVEPAIASTVSRATIRGRVSLEGSRGQQVAAGELADTLVYYVPAKGAGHTKPGHFTVYTHNRDFSPEAMALPQGSTVTFVNLDDVRHNVFSVTPGSSFNLGYQGSGEKASHAFGHAGVVLVSCNVHRSMELDMLVVPTPYSSKVGADGSFALENLPDGSGKLYFWNPRAPLVSQQVTLPMSGSVSQKIVASKPHMETQIHAGTHP